MSIGHSHHRNVRSAVKEMIGANLTITTTATELKAGVDILKGRTTIFIINDSSKIIEINTNPGLTYGGGNIVVFSGEVLTFDFEPNPGVGVAPTRLYGIVDEVSTSIRIVEVK